VQWPGEWLEPSDGAWLAASSSGSETSSGDGWYGTS
jgi:hypothetical protein